MWQTFVLTVVLIGVLLDAPVVVAQQYECRSYRGQQVGTVTMGGLSDQDLRLVNAVSTFHRGNKTYAIIVGSSGGGFLQLVEVSDPAFPVAVGRLGGDNTFSPSFVLGESSGVSIIEQGSNTYAIVVSRGDHAINFVDVSDPSSPVVLEWWRDLHGLPGSFKAPQAVSTFVRGSNTYAIVTTAGLSNVNIEGGIYLVDASNMSAPVMVGSATNGVGGLTLRNPQHVSTFDREENTYAIIVEPSDHTIQLVNVSDPSAPVSVGSATDGVGGFTHLQNPQSVSTFERGSSTYAIVTARTDGLQLVDVSDPSSPMAVGSVAHGDTGVTMLPGEQSGLELHDPWGVSTFELGTNTYAIVAVQGSHGIQVFDVSDPSSPMVVGSAFDTTTRMLRDARIVSTFERDSSIYAVVGEAGLAEDSDSGFQLISFQRCDNLCLVGEFDHDSNPATPCCKRVRYATALGVEVCDHCGNQTVCYNVP